MSPFHDVVIVKGHIGYTCWSSPCLCPVIIKCVLWSFIYLWWNLFLGSFLKATVLPPYSLYFSPSTPVCTQYLIGTPYVQNINTVIKHTLSVCISVSRYLYNSYSCLLWEKALRGNLSCLVIIFCPWRWDIKHWGIYSWQKTRCDQGNQLSFDYHMAKGSSLSEVKISEGPPGSREEVFSVLSPAGEPHVAEGKLSVPQGEWDDTHWEIEAGNSLSIYFSMSENKHKPCQRWNDSSLTIYSEPTVLEGMFKQKNRFSRTMRVGVKCVLTAQPKCFTCG